LLSNGSTCTATPRFLDAAIYVFLPQICITIQRLWQGRSLLHRMTSRTVVIGDCPWVSQAAVGLYKLNAVYP
jgi:hypothetical protein